jgi:cysteine desulfurase
MTDRIYLDHNATSPLRPEACAAMAAALAETGNASSIHAEGRAARARIEGARGAVAGLVGAAPAAVTFTSGATEAVALALSPDMELSGRPVRCDVLLISGIEHPAVRAGGRFPAERIEIVPVDRAGVVDLAALDTILTRHRNGGRRALVSVMAANNETGVIEPLREISSRVHAAEGVFHTDAVQIAGRYPFGLEMSGADLISLSSHKLGGPQGVGALIARDVDTKLPPLLRGGGQERGARAGTENVAAIAGFGAVAASAGMMLAEEVGRLAGLRDRLEEGLQDVASEAVILSEGALRIPNTTCFAVRGIAAETAVIAFDLEGVALSAGAACSSGKVGPSTALAAMKIEPELARGAMRVSLGWNSTKADVARFLEIFARIYASLTERSRIQAA